MRGEINKQYEKANKEYERIINDISNPCNNLIPSPVRHPYDLRCQTTTDCAPIRSYTDWHKKSFIPRAVSLLHQV